MVTATTSAFTLSRAESMLLQYEAAFALAIKPSTTGATDNPGPDCVHNDS